MRHTIKYYPSPLFPDEKRDLVIFKPENRDKRNGKIIFFYDGHVLNTEVNNFNTKDGIKIDDLVDRKGFVIVALSSINLDDRNKWNKRKKELTNNNGNEYIFNTLVEKIILEIKKVIEGEWIGVGISLSGMLVFKNEHLFDKVLSISPFLVGHQQDRHNKGFIFYGKKEHPHDKKKSLNYYSEPIKEFSHFNPKIVITELKDMVHDFYSWSEHFPLMLKEVLK